MTGSLVSRCGRRLSALVWIVPANSYFEHFHPYFPIVRIRDPDTCYRSSPLLFWTVVVVACRRYVAPHDPEGTALQFLVDHLPREVWAVVSATHISPPSVNALILLCAWPLTNIRFLTNPSPIYAGIAMNAALQLGLHTGMSF